MHLDIHETTFSLFFSVILILNSILINIACDCLVKRFCKCIRNGFISLDVFFIRFNFAGVFSLFVSYLFYFIENICSFVLRSLFFFFSFSLVQFSFWSIEIDYNLEYWVQFCHHVFFIIWISTFVCSWIILSIHEKFTRCFRIKQQQQQQNK